MTMLLFPELVLVYKIYNSYFFSHTIFSIIYSVSLIFWFGNNFIGKDFKGYGKFDINIVIFNGLWCIAAPIFFLKIDIFTIGHLSHCCILLIKESIIRLFLSNDSKTDSKEE